jgi:hypothetical protein
MSIYRMFLIKNKNKIFFFMLFFISFWKRIKNYKNKKKKKMTSNILIPILFRFKNREVITLPPELQQDINKFRIDGFARKYFTTHKKGIFRRKVPVEKMLLFQKVIMRINCKIYEKGKGINALLLTLLYFFI